MEDKINYNHSNDNSFYDKKKDEMTKVEMLDSVENYLKRLSISQDDFEITDRIINAMDIIDRKYFSPDITYAYEDIALPINHNQTLSQPSTVGRMLQLSCIKRGEDVLEIGTGTGWNASIMAYLSNPGKCISYEIIPELVEKATKNIEKLKSSLPEKTINKIDKIHLKKGNGIENNTGGFDKIIITSGINSNNEKKIENFADKYLKEGGRLVCPYVQGPLMIIDKKSGNITTSYTKDQYSFVSLK
ncbi:MAG: protein-L-isoaspartate O-methyltransferase family protein [Nanobdellota archaeon]